MEIEKRYELNGEIPKDLIKSKIYIEQVYSVVTDRKSIPDVRIRKAVQDDKSNYSHTVKYNTENKNSRIEIESEISEEEYKNIFETIDKIPIRKNRYIIPIQNGLIAEVDEFLDVNTVIVEVEFPNEETMNEFSTSDKKPSWIGKELKGKQSFSSQVFSQINNKVSVKLY